MFIVLSPNSNRPAKPLRKSSSLKKKFSNENQNQKIHRWLCAIGRNRIGGRYPVGYPIVGEKLWIPSGLLTNQVFGGAYPVGAAVTSTVGGESSVVSFAGLISPGLYLVRITIPQDLSPGAQVIQLSAGGLKTSSSLKLLLAPAP